MTQKNQFCWWRSFRDSSFLPISMNSSRFSHRTTFQIWNHMDTLHTCLHSLSLVLWVLLPRTHLCWWPCAYARPSEIHLTSVLINEWMRNRNQKASIKCLLPSAMLLLHSFLRYGSCAILCMFVVEHWTQRPSMRPFTIPDSHTAIDRIPYDSISVAYNARSTYYWWAWEVWFSNFFHSFQLKREVLLLYIHGINRPNLSVSKRPKQWETRKTVIFSHSSGKPHAMTIEFIWLSSSFCEE